MNPLASLLASQSAYGALVFALAATAFGFAWHYYEAVLKEKGPDRDRLLDRLAKGGGPRAFYIDVMTTMLDRVDGLLGDAGQGQEWVARVLGLHKAQPCWTGRSFDTCALLAVVYPFASLFGTWLLAGDAGPIGDLLGLRARPDWWVRPAVGAATVFLIFSIFRFQRTRSLWWLVAVSAFAGAFAVAGAGAFAGAVAVVVAAAVAAAAAGAGAGAFAVAGAGAVAVVVAGAFAGAVAAAGAAAAAGAVAFAVAGAGAGAVAVVIMARRAAALRRLGAFWVAFWPVALGTAGLGLWFGGRFGSSPDVMSFLLMIGLLPLVNLPFDWASIGMTRGLLRRGCEDHGIWLLRSPTLLGLFDFLVGLALLAALAAALVVTLTAADAILQHAGAAALFDAVGLIERIAAQPGDAAHGWVYFTLLSTLVPSFFNLLVGIFSLLTFSVPPVRRWLIATIPTLDRPGLPGTRLQAVFALSAHWFCGVLLTGLGLWLVWQVALMVPGAEETALDWLHAFAIWCARLSAIGS